MPWCYNLRIYVCGFDTIRIVHPSGVVLTSTAGKIDSTDGFLHHVLKYMKAPLLAGLRQTMGTSKHMVLHFHLHQTQWTLASWSFWRVSGVLHLIPRGTLRDKIKKAY